MEQGNKGVIQEQVGFHQVWVKSGYAVSHEYDTYVGCIRCIHDTDMMPTANRFDDYGK